LTYGIDHPVHFNEKEMVQADQRALTHIRASQEAA